MSTNLFVRPSYDDVTSYLYYYSKKLIKKSKEKGFKTINKEKDFANKEIITNIITKNNPEFIMFNGHGAPNLICGQNHQTLIETKINHNLLKKRLIYSISCSSASKLGTLVADIQTTFIGYSDVFALGMDASCQTSIYRDKRAELFLKPSNLLVESLLKGNSAKEAVQKAKELMKKNISKLKTDPFPDAKDYIPFLFHNYLVLEVLGNQKAKLKI